MRNTILIEARKNADLTQKEIAEKVHITEIGYQNYERGLREPKASVANRIAKILNSTSEKLFST